MAYAAKMPYTYGEDQEEQLPDGVSQPVDTIQPLENVQPQQQQNQQSKPQLQSESGQSSTQPSQPVPVKTFAQLQQEGFARPPMPTMMANQSLAPSDQTQTGQVNPTASQAQAPPPRSPSDLTTEERSRMSVADMNAMSKAYNRWTAGQDAATNIASQPTANWTPEAIAAKREQMLRESGFGADGTYTPETEANPYVNANIANTYNGLPGSYDPTKPPQANNGYVGPDGQYHTGPATVGPGQAGTTTGGGTMTNPGTMTGAPPTNTNQQQSTFDLLQQLINGASGNGPGSDVQNATRDAFLNYLKNPNPYGAQDVKDQYGWLGGQIDDEFAQREQLLGEEMARRGLGFSTNYGGRLQDTNVRRKSAKEVLGTDLAHNFAQNYGQSQQAALGLGNQIGTQNQNNAQSWLQQLMGYGQQAFDNDFKTNAFNQSTADSYRNWLLQMLGMGYGGAS
jgi:hypothetical protein